MDNVPFTPDEIRAVFRLDSADARSHARCGPKSPCRVNALAKCDEDLDAWLSIPVALRDLRTMVAGPFDGS